MDAYRQVRAKLIDISTNSRHSRWISACLVVTEAVLGALIIWKVQYTEIDWTTYMQQVRHFIDGERDYTYIKGNTGPLVYPANHLYIYTALYHLTHGGSDIVAAQCIFHILYLLTLAFVLACYNRVDAPPWLLATLVLSKRLHSIFLLRLFNDAWATAGLWIAIYSFQRRRWFVGAISWCLALGVKMTLLLAAPAIGAILLQGAGLRRGLVIGTVLLQLQVQAKTVQLHTHLLIWIIQLVSAFPFLIEGKGREYLGCAFDLGRKFLIKWTVNWRFLSEDTFLSPAFASALLVLHLCLLLLFFQTRWLRPSSSGIIDFSRKYTRAMNEISRGNTSRRVTATFVMDTMLGSTAIGLLCARSLHYQFFAYIGWATPYLLWRSGFGPIWVFGNWAMQEAAWLTYPSTNLSSSVVILQLVLAIASVWWGSRVKADLPCQQKANEKRHLE